MKVEKKRKAQWFSSCDESNKAFISIGCFRIYRWKASDDQRPADWIKEEGTLLSASRVAPPERMDWPVNWLPNTDRIFSMKKERVGISPADVNHKAEASGNLLSRDKRYWRKKCVVLIMVKVFCRISILFPSKNLSFFSVGRRNL